MSNNPIFQENVLQIARYNSSLANKLVSISEIKSDLFLTETPNGEPNLSLNGVLLHSDLPDDEAKKIFDNSNDSPLSLHLLFGLGIGNLLQYFAENSEGIIVLFEPNLDVLRLTFDLADFKYILEKKNVFIVSDFNELSYIINKVYINKAVVSIAMLPSYKKLYGKDIEKFISEVTPIVGKCVMNINYIKTKLISSIDNLYVNTPYIIEEPPLIKFKDIYKDKTVLLVSAGPSLDTNIETIKKYRNKAIIIAVGQAVRTLLNNGINPDFIVMIEQLNTIATVEGLDMSASTLILEPYTNLTTHQWNVKNRISYPSFSAYPNLIWQKISNVDTKDYVSSGTVSITAINSAKLLGFKNIALVGQDLSYAEGRCYTKGSRNRDMVCAINPETNRLEVTVPDIEKFSYSLFPKDVKWPKEKVIETGLNHLKKINDALIYVKDVNGKDVPTEAGYSLFIEQFRDFAAKNKGLNLVNTSHIGAQIDGFKNVSLEDFLKDMPDVNPIELDTTTDYDIKSIISNINQEKLLLQEVSEKLKKGIELITEYSQFVVNKTLMTEDALKLIREIILLYKELEKKYGQECISYYYLAMPSGVEVNSVLRKCLSFTDELLVEMYNCFKQFFTHTDKYVSQILYRINGNEDKLNEMLNSKG